MLSTSSLRTVQILRLLSDWILVRVEPRAENQAGLVLVDEEPVRIGEVLMVGPGRRYVDRFIPTEVKVGDRVAFMIGASDTQTGQQIRADLSKDQRLIRQGDILLVVEGDVMVTK